MGATRAKATNCKLCGSFAPFVGLKDDFNLFRCQGCNLLFVDPLPSDLLAIYDDRYFQGAGHGHGYSDYDRDKEPMRTVFEEYVSRIEGALGHTGSILEIGAATGFFLDICRRRGWKTVGVEPSSFAAGLGREKGLDVRTGVLEDCDFPPRQFDAVAMWDVLEHVQDPEKTVRQAARLLKPGGILAINTPDADSTWATLMGLRWHLIVPPEHIYLFSRTAATQLLQKCGFKIHTISSIGKTFTISYVLQTLGNWLRLSFVTSLASKLGRSRVADLSIPINLRDNMFILAQFEPVSR